MLLYFCRPYYPLRTACLRSCGYCIITLYLRLSDEAGVTGLWEKTDLRVGSKVCRVSYTWVSFPLPLMRMKLRQNSHRPAEKVLLSPWHQSSKIFKLLKEPQLQHVLAYKVTAVGRESLGAIWAGGLANGQRECVHLFETCVWCV